MRMIVLVCILLTGCATYQNKEFVGYVNEQNVLFESSQITAVEYVNRLDAKRRAVYGNVPTDDELFAYMAIIAKKQDAGEISREDARYLVAQKRSEVLERISNARYRQQELSLQQGALGVGLINAGAPRPMNTNQISCQSYQTGQITNTNCQ